MIVIQKKQIYENATYLARQRNTAQSPHTHNREEQTTRRKGQDPAEERERRANEVDEDSLERNKVRRPASDCFVALVDLHSLLASSVRPSRSSQFSIHDYVSVSTSISTWSREHNEKTNLDLQTPQRRWSLDTMQILEQSASVTERLPLAISSPQRSSLPHESVSDRHHEEEARTNIRIAIDAASRPVDRNFRFRGLRRRRRRSGRSFLPENRILPRNGRRKRLHLAQRSEIRRAGRFRSEERVDVIQRRIREGVRVIRKSGRGGVGESG